ncbi:MAG: 5-formyltetrahydrofolate cyclo-ligase [Pseudomonadota bacterium]|nr:5-formyltetrahydrofolate cyclo-ligase [Pseudomonadota bacterium]
MSPHSNKITVRQVARKARQHLHSKGSKSAAQKLQTFLLDFLQSKPQIKVVAGYMPINTEINVLPALESLSSIGITLCLPVVLEINHPLKFKYWDSRSELVTGKFGIRVPRDGEFIEPDLILCPLLSYDIVGNRLGYGGGFYDRTIGKLSAERNILVFGCAYAGQLSCEPLPVDNWDCKVDGVLTEEGIRFFG